MEYNQDQMSLTTIITFLTILGVTKILCSYRLVLQGKTGKETPESSRLEFSANNFALSDAEDNSRPLNRGGIADLPFENTIGNSPKVLQAKFLGSDGLFCFISTCNLAASRTFLQQLLACLHFTLDSEYLSFWYKQKK